MKLIHHAYHTCKIMKYDYVKICHWFKFNPFSGLVLQDLTFVHIGNADFLPDPQDGFINFSKRWQQYNIVINMKRFKNWYELYLRLYLQQYLTIFFLFLARTLLRRTKKLLDFSIILMTFLTKTQCGKYLKK